SADSRGLSDAGSESPRAVFASRSFASRQAGLLFQQSSENAQFQRINVNGMSNSQAHKGGATDTGLPVLGFGNLEFFCHWTLVICHSDRSSTLTSFPSTTTL